jgi:hypothetical protein
LTKSVVPTQRIASFVIFVRQASLSNAASFRIRPPTDFLAFWLSGVGPEGDIYSQVTRQAGHKKTAADHGDSYSGSGSFLE